MVTGIIGKYNLSHIWDRVLYNTPGLKLGSYTVVRLALGQHHATKVLVVKYNVGYVSSHHIINVLQQLLNHQ